MGTHDSGVSTNPLGLSFEQEMAVAVEAQRVPGPSMGLRPGDPFWNVEAKQASGPSQQPWRIRRQKMDRARAARAAVAAAEARRGQAFGVFIAPTFNPFTSPPSVYASDRAIKVVQGTGWGMAAGGSAALGGVTARWHRGNDGWRRSRGRLGLVNRHRNGFVRRLADARRGASG